MAEPRPAEAPPPPRDPPPAPVTGTAPSAAPAPLPAARITVTRAARRAGARDLGAPGSADQTSALRDFVGSLPAGEPAILVADDDADAGAVRDLVLALGAEGVPQARVRLQLAGAAQPLSLSTPACAPPTGGLHLGSGAGGPVAPGAGRGGLEDLARGGPGVVAPPGAGLRLAPGAGARVTAADLAVLPAAPAAEDPRPCREPASDAPRVRVRVAADGLWLRVGDQRIASGCKGVGDGVTVPRGEAMFLQVKACSDTLAGTLGGSGGVLLTADAGVRFGDLWRALAALGAGAGTSLY